MRKVAGIRPRLTRRRLLGIGLGGIVAAISAVWAVDRTEGDPSMRRGGRQGPGGASPEEGRLTARPGQPAESGPLGLRPLGLGGRRDGLLYVPEAYRADRPMPLVLTLHGAGGNARHGLNFLMPLADEAGLILLSPESRGSTWDVIRGGYGPDVAFIDRALRQAFDSYAVDPSRLAIGGFSDGASYALSLGITNGDLFTHILAFSPGFAAPAGQEGSPRIYVSHGTRDEVLPIDVCSRRVAPRLRRAGYDVLYREFDGPHTVPPEIAREGVEWLTGAGG